MDDIRAELATPDHPGTTVCFRARVTATTRVRSADDWLLTIRFIGIDGSLNGQPMLGRSTELVLVYSDELEAVAELEEQVKLLHEWVAGHSTVTVCDGDGLEGQVVDEYARTIYLPGAWIDAAGLAA